MKLYVDVDELYPYYTFSEKKSKYTDLEKEVIVSEDELIKFKKTIKDFGEMQDILEKRVKENENTR